MVRADDASKEHKYEIAWLESLSVISNLAVFAIQDRRTDSQTATGRLDEHDR